MPLPEFSITQFEFTKLTEDKPHLVEVEQRIAKLGYGTITVEMTVRAGVVTKMEFVEKEKWLSPKQG